MQKTCQKCGTLLAVSATVCPVCHTSTFEKLPVSDDHTATYLAVQDKIELVRLKHRRLVVILHLLFGMLGVGFFYLGYVKRGLLLIGLSVILATLGFFLPSFQLNLMIVAGAIHLILAAYYGLNPDARDERGELLG